MKTCPTCNRTFTDDALSYCLDDGSALTSGGVGGGSGEPQPYDPGATIQFIPGRETNPPAPPSYPPPQSPGYQAQPQSWSPMPPAGGMPTAPPKKKSKGIYWIIGGVAALVVLGIGGIILAVVLFGMPGTSNSNENANNANTTVNSNSNVNANNSNSSESNKNSNTEPSKVNVAQDDFSVTNWWVGSSTFGKAEYVNGEYQISGTTDGGYMAIYGPKTYDTANATTRVTTRSVSGTSPTKGYGLTVYSEMKKGLLEDYAFVIRTDGTPEYCVYLHKEGKETMLVNWTAASQIRSGSSTNQLEVRTVGSQISFYINGQFATSVADTAGYKAGIAGFYTSDKATVAFDDLEIYR